MDRDPSPSENTKAVAAQAFLLDLNGARSTTPLARMLALQAFSPTDQDSDRSDCRLAVGPLCRVAPLPVAVIPAKNFSCGVDQIAVYHLA